MVVKEISRGVFTINTAYSPCEERAWCLNCEK